VRGDRNNSIAPVIEFFDPSNPQILEFGRKIRFAVCREKWYPIHLADCPSGSTRSKEMCIQSIELDSDPHILSENSPFLCLITELQQQAVPAAYRKEPG